MDQRLLLTHQIMLADRTRLRAYERALEQTLTPGDVVLDVGAGTLVLSLLALRHGAEHVYAVEGDPQTAAVADQIIRSNDLKNRITLIQGDARVVRLPREVDVVVSEMMGNLGPEEEMAEILGAAARRNLRPGGLVVPRRLTTVLQGIQFDQEGWGVWDDGFLGYRLDAVADQVEPAAQLHFFQRSPTLLTDQAVLTEATIGTGPPPAPAPLRMPVTAPGRLHAVIGYFDAELADGVRLANFPGYPGCNWAVWIWPLRHTSVTPGDQLRVTMHRPPRRGGVRDIAGWRLDCRMARRDGSG